MSAQYKAALTRALLVGLVSAASTALTTLTATGEVNARVVLLTAAAAFLAPFAARFGGEGAYDTRRARTGNVQPGDVGAPVGRASRS
jgi:hypothetical protein